MSEEFSASHVARRALDKADMRDVSVEDLMGLIVAVSQGRLGFFKHARRWLVLSCAVTAAIFLFEPGFSYRKFLFCIMLASLLLANEMIRSCCLYRLPNKKLEALLEEAKFGPLLTIINDIRANQLEVWFGGRRIDHRIADSQYALLMFSDLAEIRDLMWPFFELWRNGTVRLKPIGLVNVGKPEQSKSDAGPSRTGGKRSSIEARNWATDPTQTEFDTGKNTYLDSVPKNPRSRRKQDIAISVVRTEFVANRGREDYQISDVIAKVTNAILAEFKTLGLDDDRDQTGSLGTLRNPNSEAWIRQIVYGQNERLVKLLNEAHRHPELPFEQTD